jgi:hypothetical protein
MTTMKAKRTGKQRRNSWGESWEMQSAVPGELEEKKKPSMLRFSMDGKTERRSARRMRWSCERGEKGQPGDFQVLKPEERTNGDVNPQTPAE